MEYIDLSLPLNDETPAFPGDRKTVLGKMKEFEPAGWTVSNIETSLHAGTHVESAAHPFTGGRVLGSYPVQAFVGTAHCIPRDQIGKSAVNTEVLLICTGFDKLYGKPEYVHQSLNLGVEEADWVARLGLKAFGTVTISAGDMTVHQIILGTDTLLIEGLCNLQPLVGRTFRLYFFPLKLDTEASPVRVVAEL